MTITIGRFGTDVNVTISRRRDSGGVVSLEGFIGASSLADSKVLRQQLNGLVDNPDEPVVPVACTDDTSLDGFYRVTRVSCDADSVSSVNFVLPFTCEMERASNSYNPLLEHTLLQALRTNGHSIVASSTVAYFGLPNGAIAANGLVGFPASVSRTGADGVMAMYYDDNPLASLYVNACALNPSESPMTDCGWYDNACLLQSKWADNSTYRTVVGKTCPSRVAAGIRSGHDWQISNGFVRVTPSVTTGAATCGCDITVEHYDGSAWDTGKRYKFTLIGQDASTMTFAQMSILRNCAEAVSIRLAAENKSLFTLDITLRRGSRFIECRWNITSGNVAVERQSVEAATALTGGIRATSNDASGNRYVLAGAQATTNDLVNGKITSGTVAAYDFMIGSEVTGSSATGQATAQNQVYQYMSAQSETYRIVGF